MPLVALASLLLPWFITMDHASRRPRPQSLVMVCRSWLSPVAHLSPTHMGSVTYSGSEFRFMIVSYVCCVSALRSDSPEPWNVTRCSSGPPPGQRTIQTHDFGSDATETCRALWEPTRLVKVTISCKRSLHKTLVKSHTAEPHRHLLALASCCRV